jgi:hypothetical protein
MPDRQLPPWLDYDFVHEAPRPRQATAAAPGSDEKVAIMRRRYLRREQLFREGDAVDWTGVDAAAVFGRSWSTWGPSKLKRPARPQAGTVPSEVADDADDDP